MKEKFSSLKKFLSPSNQRSDWITTAALLAIATAISFLFFKIMEKPSANIALTYILALFLTARFTTGYFYGIFASLFGVVSVNFMFTFPYYQLDFTLTGYPITFVVMLTISIITSAITTNMKQQAKIISEREKLLMEADKEKMRANLLRAISHDLRTPLTSIIGSSSVYLEDEEKLSAKEKRAMVLHIQEDSNWLLNMVENLLSVTRINNETAKVNKSLEPVEEVLAEAVTRLKKRIPNANIHVKVPDEVLMLSMDAVLIEQVLINLMENAIVHSESISHIDCYVDSGSEGIAFHIRDYGQGISPEKLSSIFDGSSTIGNTSADGRKGMGIGLSICKTIITAHGGSIAALNHEDGAEFYFILPKEGTSIES